MSKSARSTLMQYRLEEGFRMRGVKALYMRELTIGL